MFGGDGWPWQVGGALRTLQPLPPPVKLTARESSGAWSSCQLVSTASSLEEVHRWFPDGVRGTSVPPLRRCAFLTAGTTLR